MCLFIFFGFVAVSCLELLIFSLLADQIGWHNVIALSLLTSLAGSFVWNNIRRTPEQQVQDAVLPDAHNRQINRFGILLGAILLILPGFLTDLFGLLLFIPPLRYLFLLLLLRIPQKIMLRRFKEMYSNGNYYNTENVYNNDSDNNNEYSDDRSGQFYPNGNPGNNSGNNIYDCDYTVSPDRPSGGADYKNGHNINGKSSENENDDIIDVEYKINK